MLIICLERTIKYREVMDRNVNLVNVVSLNSMERTTSPFISLCPACLTCGLEPHELPKRESE